MADLGAIGTLTIGTTIAQIPLDVAAAQNVTTNPVHAVAYERLWAVPYKQDWKSVSGTFRDDTGATTARTGYLIRRSTGELVASFTSSGSGAYSVKTPYSDEHIRVVLDDAAGTLYNDLIDRVMPG